jgi:sialic acid synthase SpsE
MTAPWDGDKVFIIAEAGSNWRMGTPGRDLRMARTLIDVAAEARADAVKFQTYRADDLYVANAGDSDYLAASGIREPITEILGDLEMPDEMIPELARHAADRGLRFMSTPFSPRDFAAVDPFVSVHKIASYEISHLRLLELAGRSGKPLVLSTGASAEEDVAWAVETFRKAGGVELCLMQCTASYPAPARSLNLRAIPRLAQRFDLPVGLSDHSRDPVLAPVAAVALGARAIEKHFTLDNRLPGPDHAFAVMPKELEAMVRAVRDTEAMLGRGRKEVLPDEKELARYARRGIQALRDIPLGETLREGVNIGILRPGKQPLGLHPKALPEIEGTRALREIRRGEGIGPGDFGD